MTLLPGDVLLTGTPEGVGRLAAGDVVEVEVDGVGTLVEPGGRVSEPEAALDAVRCRFAPAPSGSLHVGNVRSALFSWLYARRHERRVRPAGRRHGRAAA